MSHVISIIIAYLVVGLMLRIIQRIFFKKRQKEFMFAVLALGIVLLIVSIVTRML